MFIRSDEARLSVLMVAWLDISMTPVFPPGSLIKTWILLCIRGVFDKDLDSIVYTPFSVRWEGIDPSLFGLAAGGRLLMILESTAWPLHV